MSGMDLRGVCEGSEKRSENGSGIVWEGSGWIWEGEWSERDLRGSERRLGGVWDRSARCLGRSLGGRSLGGFCEGSARESYLRGICERSESWLAGWLAEVLKKHWYLW